MPESNLKRSPINMVLFGKCLRDGRWLLLACSAALFSMMWARGYAVSMVNLESFQAILDNLPEGFQKLFPVDYSWMVSYTGRVSLAYEEPVIFLCLAIWCLARSSDCVSGQLGRGTLEMLLAQPISRLQLIVTHSAVTILGIGVLAIASWLGLYFSIETASVTEQVPVRFEIPNTPFGFPIPFTNKEVITPMSEKVHAGVIWAGTLNFFCTGLMLAGVTTLLSSFDRYRWRTLGIATGFYIVQTIMVIIAALAPSLAWLKWLSILSAYKPSICISIADERPEYLWSLSYVSVNDTFELGPLGYNLTLLATATVCYVIAVVVFQRRDLPAPV